MSGRNTISGQSYQEMLRSMAADAFLTQEKERRELASYLHDHVAQLIALAKITTGQLKESLSATVYEEQLNSLSDTINQALDAIRSLTVDLSPPDLYELGLSAALERLCDEFNEKHGIRISFQCGMPTLNLQNETKTVLYRIAKELLFNAVKHSSAQTLTVSMSVQNGNLILTVTDDGKGFNPEKTGGNTKNSFGIFSIRERLAHIGGSFELKSRKGFGARITITLPIDAA